MSQLYSRRCDVRFPAIKAGNGILHKSGLKPTVFADTQKERGKQCKQCMCVMCGCESARERQVGKGKS